MYLTKMWDWFQLHFLSKRRLQFGTVTWWTSFLFAFRPLNSLDVCVLYMNIQIHMWTYISTCEYAYSYRYTYSCEHTYPYMNIQTHRNQVTARDSSKMLAIAHFLVSGKQYKRQNFPQLKKIYLLWFNNIVSLFQLDHWYNFVTKICMQKWYLKGLVGNHT